MNAPWVIIFAFCSLNVTLLFWPVGLHLLPKHSYCHGTAWDGLVHAMASSHLSGRIRGLCSIASCYASPALDSLLPLSVPSPSCVQAGPSASVGHGICCSAPSGASVPAAGPVSFACDRLGSWSGRTPLSSYLKSYTELSGYARAILS